MDNYSTFNKYNQNWNLIQTSSIVGTTSIITVIAANEKELYVTSPIGVYRLDSNFNILNSFLYQNGYFFGLTYNSATDHILVTSAITQGVLIFDRNLTLVKNYNFANSSTTDIEEFNRKFYVSTDHGVIWVLINETAAASFLTACNSIKSISIDYYGYIAVLCSTYVVYVYNINGTFMNVTWTSTTLLPYEMSFDANGEFFLTGPNGIYYLGLNGITETKHIGASIDTSCIVASMFEFYILELFYIFFIFLRPGVRLCHSELQANKKYNLLSSWY